MLKSAPLPLLLGLIFVLATTLMPELISFLNEDDSIETTQLTTAPSPSSSSPLPTSSFPTIASLEGVLITRVIDGDTIELATKEKVRYIGIDTPERNTKECFSAEATLRNRQLVENQVATMEADKQDRDRYGRLLRYVYVNGRQINEQLVSEGLARAVRYPPNITYQMQLSQAQQQAQQQKLGLWNACL